MKVLILSHNPMGGTSNMGKTLQAWCAAFAPEELAQFYIYPEKPPEDSRCRCFYRFTDWDVLGWKPRPGQGSGVYEYGRRRTGLVYLMRNLLWQSGRWNRKPLWDWLEEIRPEVILLASGDYGFLYRIAGTIAKRLKIPMAVCCLDDYYLHNRNADSLLGRWVHRRFLKTVRNTMEQAAAVFVICDAMKQQYESAFGISCQVLHTPAPKWELSGKPCRISYLGNLGFGRNRQLVQLSRVLQNLKIPGFSGQLHVYSQEKNPLILQDLTPENGICFHGAVSGEAVRRIMADSLAVIHTESFEERYRPMVRFSISTKIAESLRNGPCILAYGPEGVASIDYLKQNGAAYVISCPEQLEAGLQTFLTEEDLRREILANARALGEQNHSLEAGPVLLREQLQALLKTGGRKL